MTYHSENTTYRQIAMSSIRAQIRNLQDSVASYEDKIRAYSEATIEVRRSIERIVALCDQLVKLEMENND